MPRVSAAIRPASPCERRSVHVAPRRRRFGWCGVVLVGAAVAGAPANALADGAARAEPRVELERLGVDDAVAEAVAHNLELLAATYDVPIARAEVITARLRLNPVLSFGADHLDLLGTHYDAVNNAGPQEFFARTDILFRAGRKRARRLAAAKTGVAVAELWLRDAVRRLILDVQRACVDVQIGAAAVELAVVNRDLFRRVVALNERRVGAGDLARVDLTRAQIAEVQATNDLRRALGDLAIARHNLALLLGRPSTVAVFVVSDALRTDEAPQSLPELRALAIERRPDLRAARSTQLMTQQEIRRELAEGRVDVSVGVEVRRQQGLAGTGNSLGVFVGVPLRIFDRNQGEIERARQRAQQAERRRVAAERAIAVEVDNAYVEYRTARDQLGSFEGGVLQKAEQVLVTAEYAYRRGEASLIELIDAQRAFNETRHTYNEARAAFARALYTIDAVTGRSAPP